MQMSNDAIKPEKKKDLLIKESLNMDLWLRL